MQLILYLVLTVKKSEALQNGELSGLKGGGHCSLIVVAFIEKDVKKLNEMEFLHLA